MWNLFEIEKKFEAHVKEVEERSRKAHWYTKEIHKGRRSRRIARWLPLGALLAIGYITLRELF
ncbi:hypothetical protein D3C71_2118200 [compost metagenome]